jgi:CRP/FNR family cyclic AMP-dependent transcriptional regulator
MNRLTMGAAEFKALAHIATKLEFFSPLKGAELDDVLSRLQMYSFTKGETIFNKGDSAEAFFIVHEGLVRILMNGFLFFRKKASLAPGDLFGEIALLENSSRTAKAVAAQPTKLFALMRTDFNVLMRCNPVFSKGMNYMAERRKFEGSH